MEYGLQLFSVRDIAEKNLAVALKKTVELGYSSVEFASFYGYSAEDIAMLLKENGLKISGTHSPFCDLCDRYESIVAYNKAIGNKNYIIPSIDLSDQEKLDFFVEKVNEIQPKLAADGITLSYHNHNFEFLPNKDGSQIFDQLLYRTKINFELDTYWAFVALGDPLPVIDRIGDRLLFIHLRDGLSNGDGRPLGEGEAPVAEVYNKARCLGIPMIVENQHCIPDGITQAKICINYLKNL